MPFLAWYPPHTVNLQSRNTLELRGGETRLLHRSVTPTKYAPSYQKPVPLAWLCRETRWSPMLGHIKT